MEHGCDQADGLLRQPSSHLSDYSLNSNSTLVTSPSSPTFHRRGHLRAISEPEENASDNENVVSQQEGHGLGISNLNGKKRASIPRKPVGNKGNSVNPGSGDLMLSPLAADIGGDDSPSLKEDFDDGTEENHRTPSNLSSHQPFTANSDHERLHKGGYSTVHAFEPSGYDGKFQCRAKKGPTSGRGSWLAVSIMILSIYSTVFSGIWLFIAILKPRYGHTVSSRGTLPFPIASTLYAAIAKSIELSFVTVFVAFIGQALSKRAMMQPKGVTIADMSMRSWVMQPGRYNFETNIT